jgi:amino acid adenylation domain-containing protein
MKTREEVIRLLNQAKEDGVHPFLESGRLRLKVSKDQPVSPELLTELKQYKEEISFFLNEEAANFREVQEAVQEIQARDRLRAQDLPLSFAQERLWFIDRLSRSLHYHISIVLRIAGSLDSQVLERAFREIIHRHEVLRTVLIEKDGMVFQEVRPTAGWRLDHSVRPMSADKLEEYVRETTSGAFDLSADYMLRAYLTQTGGQEHLLAVVIHHIAADDWSMPIFVDELVTLYKAFKTNRPSPLPPLPVQYADYALWQKQYLSSALLEKKLGYWERQLERVAPLELPVDFIRPAGQRFNGDTLHAALDADLSRRLKALSAREDVTLFMTLLAAFKVLLYRYTGQEDICVGTPVANRTQKEISPLIGFFVNMLALRTSLSGDQSFTSLLARIKGTVLGAYDHQDIPFEKVVDRVLKERDISRTPLFQVVFTLQNGNSQEPIALEGMALSVLPFESNTSKFDLTFILEDSPEGIFIHAEYSTDLFRRGSIDQMIAHFKSLLASVAESPEKPLGKLRIMDQEEEIRLLAGLNDTAAGYPAEATVIDLFEAQALRSPGNIALGFQGQTLSYSVLNEKADRLSRYLREHYPLKPDELVGVMTYRSPWMVIAILAILKSGAAYVPIDINYPRERKLFIIKDAGLQLLLVEADGAKDMNGADVDILPVDAEREPAEPATEGSTGRRAGPRNLAYVIYTSGSTGQPKGVMIEHRSLMNLCCWHREYYKLTEGSRGALFSETAFDASAWEIHPYLISGASLYPIKDNSIRYNTAELQQFIIKNDISHIYLPPQVCLDLVNNGLHAGNATILTGGEALVLPAPADLRIVNNYGPTENTIVTTAYALEPGSAGNIPIGKPVNNCRIYILDKDMEPAPRGAVGELYIAGDGLARGYLNADEKDSKQFIQGSFFDGREERLYKTCDLARWLPDGNIEYRGRIDDQVKIRGYRIELGEVETVLARSEQVLKCVVTAPVNEKGDRQLAAYIVPAGKFDKEKIRAYLRAVLPVYMVPSLLIEIAEIPFTANGKVDRKRLPAPDAAALSGNNYAPGRNDTENKLIEIWKEVLGIPQPGIYDDFFELGGHSMMAAKVMARIWKAFSVQLPVAVLFTHPSISLLAEKILSGDAEPASSILVAINGRGSKAPIFCAPPGGGNVVLYRELSRALGEDQPLYGFQAHGVDLKSDPLRSVEEMAKAYIGEMQKVDPAGPYTLLGYSFGGGIAYEMALQLSRAGYPVKQLIIFDSLAPDSSHQSYDETLPATYADWLVYFKDAYNLNIKEADKKLALSKSELDGMPENEQLAILHERLAQKEPGITIEQLKAYTEVYRTNASISYVPDMREPVDVPIVLFRAEQLLTAFTEEQVKKRNALSGGKAEREDLGWRDFTAGTVNIYTIPCSHLNMMEGDSIQLMIAYLEKHLYNH